MAPYLNHINLPAASPELELLGVTTVYGNVVARARQARTILTLAGERFSHISVSIGCGSVIASRLHYGSSREAHLNDLPNQDSTTLPESELPPLNKRHGVDFLIETMMAGDGDIIPVTIGPLTNLAMAMVKEPGIIAKILRIVAMATDFKKHSAEYNVHCDPEAAAIVINSGIPIDVTTWEIGDICQFTQGHIAQLQSSPRPLARNLAAAIGAWQKGRGHMPSLFDPLAVATMIEPDLVQWKQGTVHVELSGANTFGFTTFQEGDGPHRVAWEVNRDEALRFCIDRILSV